jgi:adenylate cyclase
MTSVCDLRMMKPLIVVGALRCMVCTGLLLLCSSFGPSALWAQVDNTELQSTMIEVEQLLEKASQGRNNDAVVERNARNALALAREINYTGAESRANLLLGEVCARTERSDEALKCFLEAENKADKQNKQLLASVYKALGNFFFQAKLYDYASRYYQKKYAIHPNDIEVIEKIGDAALANMRFDSAEYYYKTLVERLEVGKQNTKLIEVYQKMANAYSLGGNQAKCLTYYLIIEELIQENGSSAQRAILYNNLGRQYSVLNDYTKALVYFRKAEAQCSYYPCQYPEVLFANIGIALHNTGNTQQGIEYLLKSLRLLETNKDVAAQANLEHLIADVYLNSNDLYNALRHNEAALRYAQKTKQNNILTKTYKTGADVYYGLYDYENAIKYYKRYLTLVDSTRREEQINQQQLLQQQAALVANEGQIKYLLARESFKDLELQQSNFEREKLRFTNQQLATESKQREDEVRLLQAQSEVNEARLNEQTLRTLKDRQDLRLTAQQLEAEKQTREIAELRQKEIIDRAQAAADSMEASRQVVLLRQTNDFQQQKQANFRKYTYIIGSLGMLILGLLGLAWFFARRTGKRLRRQNKRIEAQKAQIEQERHKSDQLLRNILPDEVASDLKINGVASPRFYNSATVLFTDFVNFTALSENLSPEQLLAELDECFLAFDEISEKHNLEKIKTIGDAYMCAGGLPVPNETHPTDAVHAAIEMLGWLENRNRSNPKAILREMRIGIHTGPVVAGVVGKNKFAYDIWGDAVNLAARLEQYSVPGKINISKATYDAVRHRVTATARGVQSVHNKGLVEMYFVDEQKKTA